MDLLERDRERAALECAFAEAHEGRVVLVAGEAGIGKTRLLQSVLGASGGVLWGACDPLITPRPLGPLRDAVRQAGGALAAALDAGREPLLTAMLDVLAEPGVALVIEDLHWADEATLDLVALLGRRLARGCVVLTCRREELGGRSDVRRVLAALPRDRLRLIEPAPLSAAAVGAMATGHAVDVETLHRVTGGNPFFVTEALAAGPDAVPASVREAVAYRLAGLSDAARAAVQLVAVVPQAAELWLLADTVGARPAAVDEALRAGILELRGEAVAFRHELARAATAADLGDLHRRELETLVLAALLARGDVEPARLVHHARAAADADAVRRLAPVAARAAAAVGGHRQALDHWEAALAAGGPADVEALDGVATEAYNCGHTERALETRRALLARCERDGDARRTGEALLWLSRVTWWAGDGEGAARYADRAITTLEPLGEDRELARALSARSQLAMLSERTEEAVALGGRAAELARRLGDHTTLAHALTNVGTAQLMAGALEPARGLLQEAYAFACEASEDEHAVRALVNLAVAMVVHHRDDPRGPEDLERALAFATSRDLDGYAQYLLGHRAGLRLDAGDWAAAEADARAALALSDAVSVGLCPALTALGRLQSRRGDPEAERTLLAAWEQALPSGELQRIAPIAAARAEHAWRAGDVAAAGELLRAPLTLALQQPNPWVGELAWWARRCGLPATDGAAAPAAAATVADVGVAAAAADVAAPYAHLLRGDWAAAAAAWETLGCPYDAAEARCDGDDADALLTALATFDRLGAARSALALRRRLRRIGVRRVPRGPRAPARTHPAGLTHRQAEVLALLRTGATNAEIARRLVIAEKTVDHHVSAVLAKLGVRSRRDVGASSASAPRWGGPPDVRPQQRA